VYKAAFNPLAFHIFFSPVVQSLFPHPHFCVPKTPPPPPLISCKPAPPELVPVPSFPPFFLVLSVSCRCSFSFFNTKCGSCFERKLSQQFNLFPRLIPFSHYGPNHLPRQGHVPSLPIRFSIFYRSLSADWTIFFIWPRCWRFFFSVTFIVSEKWTPLSQSSRRLLQGPSTLLWTCLSLFLRCHEVTHFKLLLASRLLFLRVFNSPLCFSLNPSLWSLPPTFLGCFFFMGHAEDFFFTPPPSTRSPMHGPPPPFTVGFHFRKSLFTPGRGLLPYTLTPLFFCISLVATVPLKLLVRLGFFSENKRPCIAPPS